MWLRPLVFIASGCFSRLALLLSTVLKKRNFEELRGTSRNFEELPQKIKKRLFFTLFIFTENFEELRGTSRNFEELRGTSRNFEEPRKRPRKEKRRRLGLKLPDCTLKLDFGSQMVEKAARKDVGANWGFSDFLAQGEPSQAKNTKGRMRAPLWWWRPSAFHQQRERDTCATLYVHLPFSPSSRFSKATHFWNDSKFWKLWSHKRSTSRP